MDAKPPVEWLKALSFGIGVLAITVPKLMDLSPDLTLVLTVVGVVVVVTAAVAIVGDWIRGRRAGSAVSLEIRRVDIIGDDSNEARIAPTVFAKNDGVPTTLRDWTLDVRLQGGQMTIRGDYLPLSLVEDMAFTNQIIRRGDGLDSKTSNSPIIHGGAETGRLLFVVRGASKAQLANDDTSFVLSATDITGKRATTTQSVSVLAAFGRSEGEPRKK